MLLCQLKNMIMKNLKKVKASGENWRVFLDDSKRKNMIKKLLVCKVKFIFYML